MGFFSSLTGFFTRPAEPPVTKPAGSDGVWAPGGFLVGGERNWKLQGANKWRLYDDTVANTITVAAMARIWGALHMSAGWVVEENRAGGRRAERGADLVREGLIEAQMPTPWSEVVARAGYCAKFKGASLHEQILRRRADGRWVTDRLEDRPIHTVEHWDKADEQQPWRGVVQQTASGSTYYVSRHRLLYVADLLLTNQPDGVGILRHVTRSAEQIERFEQLEGWGYEFSLHGMPIGRAPIKALVNEACALYICDATDPRVRAFVDQQLRFLDELIKKHAKHPELSLLLDSETYLGTGADKTTPSDVRKWDLQLLNAAASGQREVRAAIDSKNREIARLLCLEWMLMGDGEGARSVHDGKTTMFGMVLNGSLTSIGNAVTNGPARRLVVLNGLDPDTCAPRVYPEPVPTETVEAACNALASLAKAGAPLRPQDLEIVNALLERMRLPKMAEQDPAELMLPRVPLGPDGKPLPPPGAPVEVNLDDTPTKPDSPAAKRRRQ